jgi:hypothetical protein
MVSTASDTEVAALATSSEEDATPWAASVTLSTFSAISWVEAGSEKSSYDGKASLSYVYKVVNKKSFKKQAHRT